MALTEEKKEEYTFLVLEGLGLNVGDVIYAAKIWAELMILGKKTFGQVPSPKRLHTAIRLIELGRGDLVPDDFKQENGLA